MEGKNVYSLISRISKFYDLCLKLTGYEKSVNNFVSQLPIKRENHISVLDAGCGTGLYSLSILKQFPNSRITAFDSHNKLVDYFLKKIKARGLSSRVHLFCADIQGPLKEIENKKFDLIITAGVLEYVNLEKTVNHLSNHLNPGGYFLNSPVKNNWVGRLVGKLYRCKPYPRDRNLKAFTKIGFTADKFFVSKFFKELHIFKKG